MLKFLQFQGKKNFLHRNLQDWVCKINVCSVISHGLCRGLRWCSVKREMPGSKFADATRIPTSLIPTLSLFLASSPLTASLSNISGFRNFLTVYWIDCIRGQQWWRLIKIFIYRNRASVILGVFIGHIFDVWVSDYFQERIIWENGVLLWKKMWNEVWVLSSIFWTRETDPTFHGSKKWAICLCIFLDK